LNLKQRTYLFIVSQIAALLRYNFIVASSCVDLWLSIVYKAAVSLIHSRFE